MSGKKTYCYDMGDKVTRQKVYWGVPSFMDFDPVEKKEDLKGYDFAVMGCPWEGVTTYRGFGFVENFTKTVRYESERYGGYMPELDFDYSDYFRGADYGDCAVKNGDQSFTFDSISRYYKDILVSGAFPIVFAGDHGLAYPLIKAFAEKYNGNIGLIHFDAHMDNKDSFGDEEYARCCPFGHVYDIPGFNPKNMVSIGIRGPRNHFGAIKKAKEHGANVITSWDIYRDGLMNSINRAIDMATDGTQSFYVTICSDVLEPGNNPGGAADLSGLTSMELGMMLYECGRRGAGSFDYMEVFPNNDLNAVSSNLAVWMTLYMMNGVAQRKLELMNKK